jgi:zinc protease
VWNLAWTVLHGTYPAQLDTLSRSSDDPKIKARSRTSALSVARQRLSGASDPARELIVHPAKVLEKFRRSAYRPERSTLIVAGKFDVAAMRAQIESLFGTWRGADNKEFAGVARDPAGSVASNVVLPADDARTVEIAIVFPMNAGDQPTRDVLAEILDERLRVIREGLGVSYGVDANSDRTSLVIHGSVEPAHAAVAAGAIAVEIERLRTWEASVVEDFARARKRLLVRALARPAGAANRASELERIAVAGEPVDALGRSVEAIQTMTIDEVKRLAEATLGSGRRIVVARGSARAAEAAVRATGGTARLEILQ